MKRDLNSQVDSIRKALRAQVQLTDQLAKTTPGIWVASYTGEGERSGPCYEVTSTRGHTIASGIRRTDAEFIALAKTSAAPLLDDLLRMRRIESAVRELMGHLDDAVSNDVLTIGADDSVSAEAFVDRLNEMRAALGETDG